VRTPLFNHKPLISAIISTYNAEQFIKGRIENLLEQTIADKLEIVIVNSNSSQKEEQIISDYLVNYKNIKYIKTDITETIYKAWNRGIRISSGTFITNANTDDRLRKDALEVLVNLISSKSSIALVYGDQYISNTPNQTFSEIKNERRTYRPQYKRLKLLRGYLAGSQSLWRSSLHIEHNIWFNENFEVAGDYDFICKVAEKFEIKKVRKILGVYYKSKKQLNKEDQNLEITYFEAAKVKDLYARRYISSMKEKDLNRLELKLKILALLPINIWGLINRLSNIYFPGYFTINKIFICWMLSLIKEHKKDFIAAKKLIEPFREKDQSQLVNLQLNNLLKYIR
jgi:glycosyltransferase involved in cell wall biosynthesis